MKARGPVAGDVFLAHGEPDGLEGLRDELAKAGFAAERPVSPALDDRYRLTRAGAGARAGDARILPTAATRPDWHNARARLRIDLNARLEALPSDAAREALIASLSKSVADGRAVDTGQGDAPVNTAV